MEILLVDDHLMLAEALSAVIEARMPGWRVRHAHDLASALQGLNEQTRLVLLDLGLPDAQGLQALQALRAAAPGVRVVVLSADDRAETVSGAIELGASGFVPKRLSGQQLLASLQATLDGQICLPHPVLATVPTPEPAVPLTTRQLDVLRLLVAGQSNKLICRNLNISESSVKTHLESVYRRLGVSTRTQAVVAAARLGLRV